MKIAIKLFFVFVLSITLAETAKGHVDVTNSKLKEFRNYMLEEVNFARTQPAGYAEMRLSANRENNTDNGAYRYLKKSSPVSALALHEILNSTALKYSYLLARKKQLSHTADGTPFTRMRKEGYKGQAMAENIACGSEQKFNALSNPQSSAIEFVKMLIIDEGIKDVGHRHNLLNPVYKSVGFGFGQNPSSSCVNFIVQDFGNP